MTNVIKINEDTVERLLNELIEEKGADFIYEPPGETCVYVVDGHERSADFYQEVNEDTGVRDPLPPPSTDELYYSCLVGGVLIKAGVPGSALWPHIDAPVPNLFGKSVMMPALQTTEAITEFVAGPEGIPLDVPSVGKPLIDVEITEKALRMLIAAQTCQDRNRPWGESRDAAVEVRRQLEAVR